MLLKTAHLGTNNGSRFYHVQSPTASAIVSFSKARVKYKQAPRVTVTLQGTAYAREYATTGELDDDPPRIRDLAGGYKTLSSFILTWEHSTPDQREELIAYDKPVTVQRYNYLTRCYQDHKANMRKRHKWAILHTEDRPRVVPAKPALDGYARVYTKDIRSALKGIKHTVRIGQATIKATVLRQLVQAGKNGGCLPDVIEIQTQDGKLHYRSPDNRIRGSIKHGARDPYAGRNGFEARIVLQAS